MKKDDFVKMGVDEELAKKLETASLDELRDYIPKARFDEVNEAKKAAEAQVKDRDGQLEALKASNADAEGLKAQIETLQADNKAKDEAHAAEIRQLRLDNAIETALTGARAKNNAAARALLKDLDRAEIGDDGLVKGLKEQIEALQKSDSYLFEAKESKKMKGAKPGESGNDDGQLDGGNDTSNMTYSQMVTYLAQNPDAKI